jgi:hypothetical protein
MRRFLLSTVLLALAACSDGTTRTYDNSTLSLLVVHTAKDACTCRFVMNQTADYCVAWTKASPDIAGYDVDETKKSVSASVLIGWTAKAHFVSDKFGCVIDD